MGADFEQPGGGRSGFRFGRPHCAGDVIEHGIEIEGIAACFFLHGGSDRSSGDRGGGGSGSGRSGCGPCIGSLRGRQLGEQAHVIGHIAKAACGGHVIA